MRKETAKKNSFSVEEFGFYDQFGLYLNNYLSLCKATNISEQQIYDHTSTHNKEMIMWVNSLRHGHGCKKYAVTETLKLVKITEINYFFSSSVSVPLTLLVSQTMIAVHGQNAATATIIKRLMHLKKKKSYDKSVSMIWEKTRTWTTSNVHSICQ